MPNPKGVNQYSKGGGKGGKKGGKKKTITSQMAGGGRISRTSAAAQMFGTGSKQHKAAIKRFGKA